jgi:hypothetical protein
MTRSSPARRWRFAAIVALPADKVARKGLLEIETPAGGNVVPIVRVK